MPSHHRLIWVASTVLGSCLIGRVAAHSLQSLHQIPLGFDNPWGDGHNERYVPDRHSPIPGNIPFVVNEQINYFEKHINESDVRRSSCPGVNALANRGYIPRSGRDVSYQELSQAARDVYNFGDDNASLLLSAEPNRSIAHVCIDLDCTPTSTVSSFKSYAF